MASMMKIRIMKKIISAFFTLFIAIFSQAQIAQTNIVEHFTNSNCSICASQNPGIYNTLSSNPNVLHITFHPSAPYASCVFSMANPSENDARTNYYSIYGSTPRLIVNGVLSTTANLSASLNTSASNMSNFEIQATQDLITSDSVWVRIVVKKVAADTMTQALLFAGAKQDTVNQSTGNGESIHQDVFRKGLTSMTGNTINLPTNVNDSSIYTFSYQLASNWPANRMQTIAILQHLNKQVINAAESNKITSIPTAVNENYPEELQVYPNPVSEFITVKTNLEYATYQIVSLQGKILKTGKVINNRIQVADLANGTYVLKFISNPHMLNTKFQILK
jgi:hypothetical protein